MIQLTKETKINRKGVEVDNSLYLVRVDSNNLALQRGEKIENYFGDVRLALTKSLNYAIKGSYEALTLKQILDTVNDIDYAIKTLECDDIAKRVKDDKR